MKIKKRIWIMVIYCIISLAVSYSYYTYMKICGHHVPIMDFFKWISMFGRSVHSGNMIFTDFFNDVNEQMQPGAMALNFMVMEKSKYDMWPLVAIGTILHWLKTLVLGFTLLYPYYKEKRISVESLLGAIAIVILSLNLNQWELLAEPFSMTCAVRTILFIIIFAVSSYLFCHVFEFLYMKQIAAFSALSIAAFLISILFASAYFVGLLGAISIAGLMMIFDRKKDIELRQIALPIIWATTVILTIWTYINTASLENSQAAIHTIPILEIVKGWIVYFGAAIIPLSNNNVSLSVFYVVGIANLITMITLMILYLKYKLERKSFFPIILVVYGMISGLVISIGRVPSYGVSTMCSSRYCIESILGLVGGVYMGVKIISAITKKQSLRFLIILWIIFLILGSLFCNAAELKIAPYRAEYQKNISQVMKNASILDDYELEICQAEPHYVRDAVQFLKLNQFSIFSNIENKNPNAYENATLLSGLWEDGWVSKFGELITTTDICGKIHIEGYIPFELPDGSNIVISVNNEVCDIIQVSQGQFSAEITTQAQMDVQLSFRSNFEFISPPDVRNLSFLITSLTCE